MATLLAEVMVRNCDSSLLRQHAVKQFFFSLYIYARKCGPRASSYELCGPSEG